MTSFAQKTSLRLRDSPPDLGLPPGNLWRRLLTTKALASVTHASEEEIVERLWPSDRAMAVLARAASAPAMTSVAGWAAELSAKMVADVKEALGAVSAAGQVLGGSMVLSWDGYGVIGVPAFVSSANAGGFVAEGQPIPVRQFVASPSQITPYKVASIAVLTREMVDSSNAEALIGDTLVQSAALAVDAVLFDANPASAARPAGLRNGIAALTASNNTEFTEAFAEDIADLLGAVGQVGGNGPYFLASSTGRSAAMAIRFVREAQGLSLASTPAVGADLVAVAGRAVACALTVNPEIETVNAATLVMDTAPGAAGTMGPERSLWQTDSLAVKVRWPVSWVLRDPRGVAWLTPNWK